MLWNEDVPWKPAISVWTWHPADTWDKTPAISQEGGVCGWGGVGGQQHLSKKQPSFPSETSWVLTDINVTKPMRHISTRCIIYIFGNQYYLLNKWATTFTGWRDFSNVPCQHTTTTTTTWRSPCAAARDAKNVHKYLVSHLNERREKKNRSWQLKAIKWNMISPCLRKIHCVIWNALFFTNVIDHWL